MSEIYNLEKWVWTQADFETMGWHDSQIYALAFLSEDFELVFDIDYILEWIHPKPGEIYFDFWTAPATLVFEDIYNLNFDISSYTGGLEIDRITREIMPTPRNANYIGTETEWLWTIQCQEGEIKFQASGYKQYFRANPTCCGQRLDRRSIGYSFDRHKTD